MLIYARKACFNFDLWKCFSSLWHRDDPVASDARLKGLKQILGNDGGLQVRDWLTRFEVIGIIAEGFILGKALCKDDIEVNIGSLNQSWLTDRVKWICRFWWLRETRCGRHLVVLNWDTYARWDWSRRGWAFRMNRSSGSSIFTWFYIRSRGLWSNTIFLLLTNFVVCGIEVLECHR